MKKRFSLITAAALVVVSVFAGMGIDKLISADNIYEQIKKFGDVLSAADKSYVDDVDTGKVGGNQHGIGKGDTVVLNV